MLAFIGVFLSLRRNPDALVQENSDRAVALMQEQFKELESEHQLRKLSDTEFAALQNELAQRLKDEVEANNQQQQDASQRRLSTLSIVVVSVFTVVVSAGLYSSLGSPTADETAVAGVSKEGEPEFMAMVASLEARLQTEPNDPDGWRMLGRSYRVLSDFDKSVAAYQQSMERGYADNVDVILDTVEAITLQAEAAQKAAYPLMAKLLSYRAAELAPENPKALWYAHIAAANTGDVQLAVKHLEALRELNPPAEVLSVVNQQLADLKMAGATLSPPAASTKSSAKSLIINIDVDTDLKSLIQPGAQLYVFAKPTDGSNVPVAVWRGQASKLPATVTLDDSLSLMPSSKFSDHDQWIVTARVSQSGQAAAQSGDLYSSRTLKDTDTETTLVISDVVD